MTLQNNPPTASRLAQWLTVSCLSLGIILALFVAAKTTTGAMQFHATIVIIAFIIAIVGIINLVSNMVPVS